MTSSMIFEKYKNLFNKELFQFFKNITKETNFYNNEFFSYIEEYVFSGGKRLRPLALILSYLQFKKFEKKILLPAIAIELYHTYTLILDDIMDEDEFRRNKPTIYKRLKEYYIVNFNDYTYTGSLFNKKSNRFATSFAIMLGNLTNILSKEAILISDYPDEIKLTAISIMEKTDKDIYFGQMSDVLFESMEYSDITQEKYIEMIKLKTGVLFGTSFELGALFSNRHDLMRELKNIGINAAIAFQLEDDIIDILGKKGHELGSDIKKGKRTLLMIKAFEKASDEEKKILNKFYIKKNLTKNEINKVINIFNKTGSIEYNKKLANTYINKARFILKKLNLNNSEILNFFLNQMINRRF